MLKSTKEDCLRQYQDVIQATATEIATVGGPEGEVARFERQLETFSDDLPELQLVEDTGEDALLGKVYFVYANGAESKYYGKVNECLTKPGWRYSKQTSLYNYSTPEAAGKALVTEKLRSEKLHHDMNKAIASRFMEPAYDF